MQYLPANELLTQIAWRCDKSPPDDILASKDAEMIRLVQMANSIGQELVFNASWPQLLRQFHLGPGKAGSVFPIPGDWAGFYGNSGFNQTTLLPLIGQATPGEWAYLRAYFRQTVFDQWRLQGRNIEFITDIEEEDAIRFDYASANWTERAGPFDDFDSSGPMESLQADDGQVYQVATLGSDQLVRPFAGSRWTIDERGRLSLQYWPNGGLETWDRRQSIQGGTFIPALPDGTYMASSTAPEGDVRGYTILLGERVPRDRPSRDQVRRVVVDGQALDNTLFTIDSTTPSIWVSGPVGARPIIRRVMEARHSNRIESGSDIVLYPAPGFMSHVEARYKRTKNIPGWQDIEKAAEEQVDAADSRLSSGDDLALGEEYGWGDW